VAGAVPYEWLKANGLTPMLESIRHRLSPLDVLVKLKKSHRDYLQRLLNRFGRIPEPKVKLSSIHGAKGREADTVIVSAEMTRRTYTESVEGGQEGAEAENRCAYVAASRAKTSLRLVEPSSPMFYPYPTEDN